MAVTMTESYIIGAVLIALHGIQAQATERAGRFGNDPVRSPEAEETKRLRDLLLARQPAVTTFENICDRLAHAKQTLRLTDDEWDRIIKIKIY